ncbi:prevent-host-death protein [Arthrobacter sp. NIO-1057]|uniref:prevent-host-death protein n=1 Tax=Arthrobacter sp. NIO-1057 TaxID=993071 RepID=UPI00071C253F|nr:prevent-host-death protein [Arthrobacter sp. NIO-1057]KSU67229.1 prevent-host-death protein [Arthrobacter sp. NIO-1057]SCC01262.1 Antitoxin of toxin-antitoxin, RelE / RelB, TA system [Arthrobacter sp. NIO-1057]
MTNSAHYPTLRAAREHLKDVMDVAMNGLPVSVTRGGDQFSAIDTKRLLKFLLETVPSDAQVVPEADGWSVFLPRYPISADGATYDEALDEMVLALRDYAQAWTERLRLASNHENNWGLVQLIDIASDDQLKAWLA